MKELTIEQKARAYDEALERAKKLQKTCDSQAVVGWCEYIFPVLKESEDERIRKEFCKDIWTFIPNEKAHKYIAWLEKQGTPKQVSIWKHWKDGIAGNGEGKPIYLVKIGNAYSLNSCLGFECDYIELSELDNLMLEKQGHTDGIIEKAKTEKQRVIITETDGNANIDWNTRSLEDARKLLECGLQYINTEIEKQGKKPADKVEPIFRVGDYIRNKKTDDKVLIEQLDMATKAYCYVNYDGAAVNHSDFPFAKQDEWELLGNKVAEQKLAEDSAKVSESSIEEKDMTEYKKGFECGKQRVLKYPEDFGLCKKPDYKFKIGDWIINHQTGLIKHIKNVLLCGINGIYEFESSSMPIDYVDNAFHLWSIEDAKDGDVLATKDAVFIFKHMDKAGLSLCKSYCEVIGNSELGLGLDFSINNVHPATKEQRDLLFQKMKESGYEWDAEKKELKKIVAPIFHIGDRVRYKGHSCDGIITEITNTDYICGNAKLPISTQDKLELVEQNPVEWKQENIEELTEFENAMMHIGGSFFGENAGLDPNDTATIKEQAELLLELAPKTKWSEEDEKIRKSLLRWVQSNSYTSIAGIQINDVIAWLERISLRRLCSNNTSNSLLKMMKRTMMLRKKQGQRRQINVTDKELAQARKEAYNEVLDKIEYHDEWPTFDDGWNAAIWYLKKRNGRPQSHWKPSDDQMEALKASYFYWKGITKEIPYAERLESLYEQLKKLTE